MQNVAYNAVHICSTVSIITFNACSMLISAQALQRRFSLYFLLVYYGFLLMAWLWKGATRRMYMQPAQYTGV